MSELPTEDAGLDLARIAEVAGAVLARRLGGDGVVEICDTISGNINSIFKIRYQGRYLGVRIASNEYRFRYEKTIIKEVFAILLIYHNNVAGNDARSGNIIDSILRSPVGAHVRHALVRGIVHYDWSLTELPFPFFIFEWVEGEVLWRHRSADQYFLAGVDLARVHCVRFEAFYRDIFAIYREPLDWRTSFETCWRQELTAAAPRLSSKIVAKLESLEISGLRPGQPCLVHNDYAGANIIVEPSGGRRIIDWDNWVVACSELDMVKMKYWSRIGDSSGVLEPDSALFSAFVEGYNSGSQSAIIDPGMFRAYELLWLIRVYNFESAREDAMERDPGGASWAGLYPGAQTYESYLRDL